jgi:hypothetical protein
VGTPTFVFTDIEGSTGQADRLGDGAWSKLLRQHNELLDDVVAEFGGRAVKNTGDGAMLVFDEALAAVHCSRQFQQRAAAFGLPIRAGIHTGEAVDDGDDFIGVQVHVAARVAALASGGELLVSAAARHQIGDSIDIFFGPARTVELRGLSGLHRVYPVESGPREDTAPQVPLVGRDEQLAQLSEVFERGWAGDWSPALVAGEPGAGKTRLVEEATRRLAGPEVSVHRGRCWERPGAPAYLPFMEVMRSLVGSLIDGASTVSEAGNLALLGHVLPDLVEALGPTPALPDDPEGARLALFDAVVTLVRRAALNGPVVIILEDMHRSDSVSIELLLHLSDALADAGTDTAMPVVLLVTARSTEAEMVQLLDYCLREPPQVKLSPLDVDDVRAYLTAELGEEPDQTTVAAVSELADGNPFNLTQLVPSLRREGTAALSTSVQGAIRRRLQSLSPDASWVLETAAFLGTAFEVATLCDCTGLGPSETVTALDEAAGAGILEWESPAPTAAFAHQLLQKAVYERVAAGQRAVLHGQIARTLDAVLDDADTTKLGQTVYHYVRAAKAGFVPEAIDRCRQVAVAAASIHAHEEAARALRDALELWPSLAPGVTPTAAFGDHARLSLQADLAASEFALGHRIAAWEVLENTVEPAITSGAYEVAARAILSWQVDWVPVGEVDPTLMDRLLKLLPGDSRYRAPVLAMNAALLFYADDARCIDLADRALAMAESTGDLDVIANTFGRAVHVAGSDCRDLPARVATALPDTLHAYVAHREQARRALSAGDLRGLNRSVDELIRCADGIGAPLQRADARWRAAGLAINRGDADAASALMTEAAGFEQRSRNQGSRVVGVVLQFVMARNAGTLAALAPMLALGVESSTLETLGGPVGVGIAMVNLADGQPGPAQNVLQHLPRHPYPGGAYIHGLVCCLVSDMAIGLGDLDAVHQMLELLGDHGIMLNTMPGSFAIYGTTSEVLGRLELVLGREEEGLRHVESARDLYVRLGATPLIEQTDALLALGGALPGDAATRAKLVAEAARIPTLGPTAG